VQRYAFFTFYKYKIKPIARISGQNDIFGMNIAIISMIYLLGLVKWVKYEKVKMDYNP
jgi:hypothetical protein